MDFPPFMSTIHSIFHVYQLKKYVSDISQIMHHESIQLNPNLTFNPMLSHVVDYDLKTLTNKTIPLVKVVLEGMSLEEATWEVESKVLEKYLHLFG